MDAIKHAAVVLYSIHLNNSLAAASLALLYYDYCLTFALEVEHFWLTARTSLASFLFVVNRYLGLIGPIPVMLEYFGHFTPERCRQLQSYHQYYAIVSQTVVGAFLILRTYAFYDRSKWLLAALLAYGLSLIIFTVVMSTMTMSTNIRTAEARSTAYVSACDLALTPEQGLSSAIGWMCMLALDTAIFALTTIRAIRLREGVRCGLLQVLFRDGAVYYGILVIANVTNILTFLVPNIGDSNRGLATTVTNALASTLVSRTFLNLRHHHRHPSARMIGQHSGQSRTARRRFSDRADDSECTPVSTLLFRAEDAEDGSLDG